MTTSKRVYRAMINLENDPNFSEVVKWLTERASEQGLAALETDGEKSIKLKGRALEDMEILEHIAKAHETHDRMPDE